MWKFIIKHFLKMMRDQRGEVGLDIDNGKDAKDSGASADDALLNLIRSEVDIDLGDDKQGADAEVPGDEGNEDKGDKKADGKKDGEAPETETDKKLKEYERKLARLEEDKGNLKKALHEARQERKSKKKEEDDGETVLTDQQVLAILEEHKDDPKVMLNAIKYLAKQEAKGIKKDTLNESEIRAKKADIDKFLAQRYPQLNEEGSDVRVGVDKAKEALNLADHPFADYLAVGAGVLNQLPDICKHWFEEGKKAALDGKADEARKQQIKDGNLTPGKGNKDFDKGKGDTGLTPQQLETAKRLGFTTKAQLKLYKDQILRNRKPRKED